MSEELLGHLLTPPNVLVVVGSVIFFWIMWVTRR